MFHGQVLLVRNPLAELYIKCTFTPVVCSSAFTVQVLTHQPNKSSTSIVIIMLSMTVLWPGAAGEEPAGRTLHQMLVHFCSG